MLHPKSTIITCLASFLAVSSLLFSATAEASKDILIEGVPLPAGISPLHSDATASPFAGTWIGEWDGLLKTMLVVETINADGTASVVYAVEASPQGHFEADWSRFDAEIKGQVLTLLSDKLSMSFELSQTGRLKAVYGDGFSFAVLAKHKLDTLRKADTSIAWNSGRSEQLQTQLVEDGKRVSLETVVFKPAGKGPFPLAIINHGSTGAGNDQVAFTKTWTSPWFAEALNERGWMVAFPQRRGRGKSDGLYNEGFAADRNKGYTCEAKRSLAGAERALEDIHAAVAALRQRADVNAEAILLAGNSRGGILSVAYAGLHPKQTHAVINFVGGWIGDDCDSADEINQTLFTKGAEYPRETLWLYGKDDYFYSMKHSQNNFKAFQQAGGSGNFVETTVRGENNGHWVMSIPPLWQGPVLHYLDRMEK